VLLSAKSGILIQGSPFVHWKSRSRSTYLFGENIWNSVYRVILTSRSFDKFGILLIKSFNLRLTVPKKSLVVNPKNFATQAMLLKSLLNISIKLWIWWKGTFNCAIINSKTKKSNQYALLKQQLQG
jgi:hypothetical protein